MIPRLGDLVGTRPAENSPICRGCTNGFNKLNVVLDLHDSVQNHVLNDAMTIKNNNDLWVEDLRVFHRRVHLKVDASCTVEGIVRLYDLCTASPPPEAQFIRQQKKRQEVGNAPKSMSILDP